MGSPSHELELSQSSPYAATLIISVYRDIKKLACVLCALSSQSVKNFEVLISEDGDSIEMQEFLSPLLRINSNFKHLSHPDIGFRKNRALNNAVKAASADLLIFIDGDCVPHPRFVESHISNKGDILVSAGRRVELGPIASKTLVAFPHCFALLTNPFLYLIVIPFLALDRVKNPESGIYSKFIQKLSGKKDISVVGCNFSCSKKMLLKINGFNNDYEAPGIGEDTDVEWRLREAGYKVNSLKFVAILFHLYHPRTYQLSSANVEIYKSTVAGGKLRCENGLSEEIRRDRAASI